MLLPESERSSFGHVISSLEQHDSKADGSPSKAGDTVYYLLGNSCASVGIVRGPTRKYAIA